MTNQAIGETTIAIKTLLKNVLGNDYVVSLSEPWSNLSNKGVNLFLYRIEENAQWKNMDWPGTPGNPIPNNHPPLSLDLYYLLTPYAPKAQPDEDDAECHRILGMAMQVIHENPVLNNIHLAYFNSNNNQHFPNNLRDNYEKIKMTLHPASLEELSKIWSMGNSPYKLSVCYHVSIIQITPSKVSTIQTPVKKVKLDVTEKIEQPDLVPSIEKIEPETANTGDIIKITGKCLNGERIKINIGSWSQLIKKNLQEEELSFKISDEIKTGDYYVMITIEEKASNTKLIQIINNKP